MLTWYAQEQSTSCVAACVRMVLTGFGVTWTEGQVRSIFGRPRLGITLTAAHARLVHAGARVALHEDWSLDDLREALGRTIHILDPVEGPQPQRYGREAFVLAWQMAGHEALIIEAPPPRPTP
jgi:hypothetical protein